MSPTHLCEVQMDALRTSPISVNYRVVYCLSDRAGGKHMPRIHTPRRGRFAIVVAILTGIVPVIPAFGGAALFQPLGFLHPDNAGPVLAYGISADGSVVV